MATERKFFLALTVKNEGPNLWEWVAYHRVIGFTDIAIYQNDSTDGTQKMLRTMENHGFIQYFNNPSRKMQWQNKAYRRASRLPEYLEADWAMALDCDEFLVVNTGNGTVTDLVDALPAEANACTVHWKIFGSNFHAQMPKGLVTEEFTLTEAPSNVAEKQVGFKSIFRPEAFRRIGIHKPKDAFKDMPSVMCNGSGILLDPSADPGWRSKDPGCRKLAQVNHYAIRDLERFFIKSGRGRTANHQRQVDIAYWRSFDVNDVQDLAAVHLASLTREEMARMSTKTRGRIARLHDESLEASRLIFEEMMRNDVYSSAYEEISAGFPQSSECSKVRLGIMQNLPIAYSEVIETNSVKVPFVPEIITPAIERPMRNSRYEGGECQALRELLQPGDSVLEFGAGVGLLSTVAAKSPGIESVVAIEANPNLIPLIQETHKLNNVDNVSLLNGVVAQQTGASLEFYLRADFWASSMEPDSRPYVSSVKIPSFGIKELIAKHDPTVIVCDIEGGELGLFDEADLSNVRLVVMEFHPKVYGDQNVEALYDLFNRRGLQIIPVEKPSTVRRFLRATQSTAEFSWPPKDPRILITTCMKDEGPFILEWIAWHKAIGIQDFVVFTNDCSDGTDLILDRLEEMGMLRHLPNPAEATGSTFFQPVALAYTPYLSEWRKADFYISMDVDEFINIHVGKGRISDLFLKTGSFDALSISELNHGSNNQMSFEPGLVTEQFPRHQTEHPGARKSQRGVKTIVRLSDKLDKIRNHRPDFHKDSGPICWLDGSGRKLETLSQDTSMNGIDVRGSYELVTLNHFPLRSLDGYLLKMFRGDVVVQKNRVSQRYWRLRNRNEEFTSAFTRQQEDFRKELNVLMADKELKTLYDHACRIHQTRALSLRNKGEFKTRREWILENAWDGER